MLQHCYAGETDRPIVRPGAFPPKKSQETGRWPHLRFPDVAERRRRCVLTTTNSGYPIMGPWQQQPRLNLRSSRWRNER